MARSSILKVPKTINKIKQSLVERKQELEEQLSRMHEDKHADPGGRDIGDQTMSSIRENLKNSLQDTELNEYNRVLKALKMIEDGSYGICVDCSKDISEKRLQSYPNTTRCIGCQEVFEEMAGA